MKRFPWRVFLAVLAGLAAGPARAIPDAVSVTVTNPYTGAAKVLQLERYNLRATNFHVRVYGDATNYTVLADLPEVCTFRGRVQGESNSFVSAAFTPAGRLYARVSYSSVWWDYNPDPVTGDRSWSVGGQPTEYAPASNGYVYVAATTMPVKVSGITTSSYPSAATTNAYGGPRFLNVMQRQYTRISRLCIDVVKDFYDAECGSIEAAIAQAECKINDADFVTARDDMLCYELTCVAIRPVVMDPYLSSGTARLGNLNTFWTPQRATVPFDKVAAFTIIGGGVAYAPGDYSIEHGDWYGGVVAHEVGHNWWAKDYEIQYFWNGTTTYHHAMNGSGLAYCPQSVDRAQVNARGKTSLGFVAYKSPLPPYATPDYKAGRMNTPLELDVLMNDHDVNSNALSVVWFETNSLRGGRVSAAAGGRLAYAPPTNFVGTDWFHYQVGDGTGFRSPARANVFVTDPADPLIARWAFDETNGLAAADSARGGVTGRLNGADFAADGVAGVVGRALHFDGGSDVWVGPYYDPADGDFSVSVWARPDAAPGSEQIAVGKQCARGNSWDGWVVALSGSSISFYGNLAGGDDNEQWSVYAPIAPQPGAWYHIVGVLDRTAQGARIFVNGMEYSATWNRRTLTPAGAVASYHPLRIGAGDQGGAAKRFVGVVDDVRIYGKALGLTEATSLFSGGGLLPASGPAPAHGAIAVALGRTLTWSPGRTNYQHRIYFGTNEAEVAAADMNAAVYRGLTNAAAWATGPLAGLTTYYWRIDEVEGGSNVVAGAVWHFTTAVDDLHGELRLYQTFDTRHVVGVTAHDSAGPTFDDGTLVNGPLAVTGAVAQALDFDGTNDYVGLGNPAALNFAGPITLMAWVRPRATDGLRNILMHGHRTNPNQELGLRISAGQYQVLTWDGADHSTSFAVPPGDLDTWVHLAGTYDGAVWRLYRNGVQVGTRTDAVGAIMVSENWAIGARGTGSERFFRGGIDEVAIWARGLGSNEVQSIFTNSLAGRGLDGEAPAPAPGSFTWTGDTDASWTNSGNWAAAATPGVIDLAVFDSSSAKNLATELGVSRALHGLDVHGTIRGVSVAATNGAFLTLGGGGLAVTGTYASVTLAAPALIATAQTWAVGAGAALTVAGVQSNFGRTVTYQVDGSATLNGKLTGAGFIKDGAGTLTINNWNSLSSGTTTEVRRGTLLLTKGSWYNGSDLGSSTLVVLTGAVVRTTATHVFDQAGHCPLRVWGGRFTFGPESYMNSSIELRGGVLDGGGDARCWGAPVTRAATNASVVDVTLNMVGGGTYAWLVEDGSADPDLIVSARLYGGAHLVKNGPGTMRISEGASYSGNTTVNQGTLQLFAVNDALPAGTALTVAPGATVDVQSVNQAVVGLNGAGEIRLGEGTLIVDTVSNLTYGGVLFGAPRDYLTYAGDRLVPSGGLAKDGVGTLTLTNRQAFAGDTVVYQGALALVGAGALSNTAQIQLDGGTTLDVTARTNATLTLAAHQALLGLGRVLGRLDCSGGVRPGNEYLPGTLTVAGSWTQRPAARLEIELAAPDTFDRVVCTGAVQLAGTLAVALTNGFVPQMGDRFPILAAAGRTGAFVATNLPGLPPELGWTVQYLPTGVVLAVEHAEPPPEVRVLATDSVAAEPGLDTGMLTFQRTGSGGDALTVEFTVAGSATPGLDYAALGTAVTFNAGATSAVVTVTALDDHLVELEETLVVTLRPGMPYGLGSPATAQVAVVDNDVPAWVNVAVLDGTASEPGPDTAAFSLQRAGATAGSLTVYYSVGGSASPGVDYTALAGWAVIAAGSTDVVVTVTALDDGAIEGVETVTLGLLPDRQYLAGSTASGTVSLADDEGRPVISLHRPATNQVYLPTGVGLVLEAAVTDDGLPAATTVQWSRISGPGEASFGMPNQPTSTVLFAADGIHRLRLTASDGAHAAATDVVVHVGAFAPSGSVLLIDADVGLHQAASSRAVADNAHTIVSAGADGIQHGRTDAFHFAYCRMVGDCSITARVTDVVAITDGNRARVGVMIRESLDASARSVFIGMADGPKIATVTRSDPGGWPALGLSGSGTLPQAVKITRTGDTFTAYILYNTGNWSLHMSPRTISMGSTVLVGLASTSGSAEVTTNRIDRVGITGDRVEDAPLNWGPLVSAGPDRVASLPGPVALAGTVVDDGLPALPGAVTLQWNRHRGAGVANFSDAASATAVVTFAAGGQHRLRLTADDGAIKTFDDALVSASTLTVRVEAPDPAAAEAGLDPAAFRISLDGEMESIVPVALEVGGTATPDVDYGSLPFTFDFLPGMTAAVFAVSPLADSVPEGPEQVTLTLAPAPFYELASPATATVVIADLPMDQWRTEVFGAMADWPEAGDEFDFDEDGWTTLAEYALGGNPVSNDAPRGLELRRTATQLMAVYRRPTNVWGISYFIDACAPTDGTWSNCPALPTTTNALPDGWEEVGGVVTGDEPARLLRLRITRP